MIEYVKQHRSKVLSRYYVYLHIRQSDQRIFYVGKGCGSRAWNAKGRSKYWNNIALKCEYTVKIVAHNLLEKESLILEKRLISEFSDSICNLTSGGESPVFSVESLKKMSESRKGKSFSQQHKINLGLSRKGKPRVEIYGESNPNYDNSVYEFQNITTSFVFKGTRHDLCKTYNLEPAKLKGLFLSTPRKSAQGWKLKEQNDNT
jgi:hypothetical protein